MSPASHGAHMSQIGRTVALLRSHASFGDLVALMKPRVMSLVVFTGFVGLYLAPGHMHPVLAAVAVLCIAVGAGASGAINMWYDRDIDVLMSRTKNRPLPAGRNALLVELTERSAGPCIAGGVGHPRDRTDLECGHSPDGDWL